MTPVSITCKNCTEEPLPYTKHHSKAVQAGRPLVPLKNATVENRPRLSHIIFFLITAFFLFSCFIYQPCAQASAAGGIDRHWAERDIEKVIQLGIASGYPGQPFEPDRMVTRAEFVRMLTAAGWVRAFDGNSQPTFKDVGTGHWAYPFVEAAAAAGIVAGEGKNERDFAPDRVLTRAEMAAMAGRLMAAEHLPGVPAKEVGEQGGWLALLHKEGLISGYPDGSMREGSGLTRAEACAVVLRLKEKLLAAHAGEERRWISSSQRKDGYIVMGGGRPDILPYFGNLTEMAQLDKPEYLDGVRKYLVWYLANLNYPDSWGLNGTIYDRRLEEGAARSVYEYDSADSYAATLLSLVDGYCLSSGEAGFARDHYRDLSTVSEIIITLQDSDGLVWAKPDRQFKYLMDNCECYRGLKDWSHLLAELGYQEQSSFYDSKAELIKKGILERFWDEDTSCFAWAVGQGGEKCLPSPGEAYPGLYAQIYPATFGVIPPESEKAVLAYRKLNEELPRWAELEVGDPFPWAILGYAAAIMDDLAGADRFLENCRSSYVLKGHCFPWSTFEGGFYVRTCEALREK